MADKFGALSLPTVSTELPLGDPSLRHLADFCRAVINAECSVAWATARPRSGELALPCRSSFTHNPTRCDFDEKSLPAVFVYREKGASTFPADDYLVDAAQVSILWVYPPADHQNHQSLRAAFHRAVAASLQVALDNGAHRAWSSSSDTDPLNTSIAAQPNAICAGAATSLSPTTLTRDGSIGSATFAPLRAVTVTTEATGAPAYNTTNPITISCEDWLGQTILFSVQLTQPNGGETISIGWDVRKVSAAPAIPAQLSTSGSISVGLAAFQGRGSSLAVALGLLGCPKVTEIQPQELRVSVLDNEGRESHSVNYDALKLTVMLPEQFTPDPTLHAHTPWGADIGIILDGFLATAANLPDAAE